MVVTSAIEISLPFVNVLCVNEWVLAFEIESMLENVYFAFINTSKSSEMLCLLLYWSKGQTVSMFYFQGRTALWDSILLLCHRIKVGYGGIVRGMHLGSSALSILPVLESENED